VGFFETGEEKDPSTVFEGDYSKFRVVRLSPLKVGEKYHLEGVRSGQNVAVMPDGRVHAHGGRGDHATWTVHGNRGHIQLKNDSGSFLAIGDNGVLRKGVGGKWCDFIVTEHEGCVLIRSAQNNNRGVGFDETGEIRDPSLVRDGNMAKFNVINA
jgi:hypothetical protein